MIFVTLSFETSRSWKSKRLAQSQWIEVIAKNPNDRIQGTIQRRDIYNRKSKIVAFHVEKIFARASTYDSAVSSNLNKIVV